MEERPRHAAAGRRQGDLVVRVGAAVFFAGVVGVLAMVLSFFGQSTPPLAIDVLATLTPVGLAIALVGLVRGARAG